MPRSNHSIARACRTSHEVHTSRTAEELIPEERPSGTRRRSSRHLADPMEVLFPLSLEDPSKQVRLFLERASEAWVFSLPKEARLQVMEELALLLHCERVGLEFKGALLEWIQLLSRRRPEEAPCTCGLSEMHLRITAARQK